MIESQGLFRNYVGSDIKGKSSGYPPISYAWDHYCKLSAQCFSADKRTYPKEQNKNIYNNKNTDIFPKLEICHTVVLLYSALK